MGVRNSSGQDSVRDGRRAQSNSRGSLPVSGGKIAAAHQAGESRKHRRITMRADKVRELDSNELRKQTGDMREQAFRIRFQMAMGQTDGLKKLRGLRKDRARMLTILRDRELHPDTAPEPVAKKKKKKGK